MYCTKNQYRETVSKFLTQKHGSITKLTDKNGVIFGYMARCQTDQKDLVSCSLTFDLYYYRGQTKKTSLRELKFYSLKRTLEKWKNRKKYIQICKLNELLNNQESLFSSIKSDISIFYENTKVISGYRQIDIDIDEISKYIVKFIKNIKNYYKDKENISIIFI